MVAYGRYLPNIKEALQIAPTFFLTVIGWIIFRAESISQAACYLTSMVTHQFFDASKLYGTDYLCAGILLLLIEWQQRDKQHALQFSPKGLFKYTTIRYGIYLAILLLLIKYSGEVQTFIYFQF